MISRQKIFLIVIAVLFVFSLIRNVSRLIPETRNYETYTVALKKYNNNNFSDSYLMFGKISRFSKLKSAAIYRQALCAEKLGDYKTEIKKYKEIIKSYPHSELATRAKYLKAQGLYEDENYKKAKKEFKNIIKKYPQTDYSIAAKYYLGSIETNYAQKTKSERKKQKAKTKAVMFFKAYLKEAPNGKFAINCAEKWSNLEVKLNNEDNMLLAKAYQENGDYKSAAKFLKLTNLGVSWPYFVRSAYEAKNYSKVKYYTELGLKGYGEEEVLINEDFDEKEENENIYKAIDMYLKTSNNPKIAISYLLSISRTNKGQDYLLYKNCNNLPAGAQPACFNTLYYKYPDGQFAAESLSNIFYNKIKNQDFTTAKKLGRLHLRKFPESNSAPKVTFWLAKTAEMTRNYDEARSFYKKVIRQYPDDYYAYRAFLNLNRYRYFDILPLRDRKVEFPYKNSSFELISELVKVKDYGLLNQLYKDDDFIQSWLFYQQGDFASSARVARDAMDRIKAKPGRFDLRWRLVYPIHYYDQIKLSAEQWRNDPTLILSIIREESYFNPIAKSPVGARGLMQLMPATAREAASRGSIPLPSESFLYDPDLNIKLGNIYYAKLKRAFADKNELAVLSYNGGIGSVMRWTQNLTYLDLDDFVEQIPYSETQNYLKKVYRSYWNYLRIYDGIKF